VENSQEVLANSRRKKTINQGEKRAYVSQAELPSHPLRDAPTVAQAVTDNYAGKPAAPHDVALALDLSPPSSGWRDLAAASLGYGLTKGSWNASKVELTELGRRATAPVQAGDDIRAEASSLTAPQKSAEGIVGPR
jgi:hypothetical protein